jgi:hypothetical protein
MTKRQRKKRSKRLQRLLDERMRDPKAAARFNLVVATHLRDMLSRRSVASILFDVLRPPFIRFIGHDQLVHAAASTPGGSVSLCWTDRFVRPDPRPVADALTCLTCLAEWSDPSREDVMALVEPADTGGHWYWLGDFMMDGIDPVPVLRLEGGTWVVLRVLMPIGDQVRHVNQCGVRACLNPGHWQAVPLVRETTLTNFDGRGWRRVSREG